MARVVLEGIVKRYGSTQVVHGVDLDIADGEFVVLVGPSGCGKSTLLRMVAGLEEISGGRLLIDGVDATGLTPQKRNIAMVFQSYALYPHLTAYDNMAFGPRLRREDPADTDRRIRKASDILNLTPYLKRLPKALSGGQRQRVAMGRAIVRDPAVFLFDEPLSNLDAKLRVQMRTEIKALHQTLKTTIIYVTHDQIEAMTLADRIVVMNGGRIEQQGRPLDLYDRPANLFVAGFLGSPTMGVLPGRLATADGVRRIVLDGDIVLPAPTVSAPDGKIVVGIRPEHLEVATDGDGLPMDVDVVEPTGAETHFYGRVAGSQLCVVSHDRKAVAPGQTVRLHADLDHLHLFDPDSGRRLN